MNKLYDLTDIQRQLLAVDDWLANIEQRLTQEHACLGKQELDQARSRVALVYERVTKNVKELCKSEPS